MNTATIVREAQRLGDTPRPEPNLTVLDRFDRASALVPMLRDQATRADELGHYSPEVHEAFAKAASIAFSRHVVSVATNSGRQCTLYKRRSTQC
jgi:hypothetical protein